MGTVTIPTVTVLWIGVDAARLLVASAASWFYIAVGCVARNAVRMLARVAGDGT